MPNLPTSSFLTPLSAIASCKRPIPPPQDRRNVLAQVPSASGWIVLDDEEDLQMCMPTKRIRLDSHDVLQTTPQYGLSPKIADTPRESHDYPRHREREVYTSFTNSGRKSLFSSEAYRCQTRETNRQEKSESTRGNGTSSEAGKCDSGKTADGWSFEHLNNDKDTVDRVSENDQEEARHLASMTNKNLVSMSEVSSTASFDTFLQDGIKSDDHDIACEQFARAGQERSRFLRERALARRSTSTQGLEEDYSFKFSQKSNEVRTEVNSDNKSSVAPGSTIESQQCDDLSQTDLRPESKVEQTALIDVNTLFDIACQSAAVDGDENKNTRTISWLANEGLLREKEDSNSAPHPASRAAAERYRTQSRHLKDHIDETASTTAGDMSLEECERRLRAFTSQTHPHTTVLRGSPPIATVEEHGLSSSVTLGNSPNARSSQLHQLPYCEVSNTSILDNDIRSAANEDTVGEDEQLSAKDGKMLSPVAAEFSDSRSTKPDLVLPLPKPVTGSSFSQKSSLEIVESMQSGEDLNGYPDEPPDLALPKNFDQFSHEQKAIIVKHETQKERLRDLEAIIPTFEQTARAGALSGFADQEAKEIRLMQQYRHAVLDRGLSGKIMRKRIGDIRANMIRRIQKLEPGDDLEYEGLLDRLLPKQRREGVAQLISKTQSNVEHLAMLRRNRYSKPQKRYKKNAKSETTSCKEKSGKSKHVRFSMDVLKESTKSTDLFADLPDGTEIELPDLNAPTNPTTTLTERKRNAQYAAADRREELIRNKLAMFIQPGTASTSLNVNDDEVELDNLDDESETSEEEDGAELFTAPTSSQNIVENTIEHENTVPRDINDASVPTEDSQRSTDQVPTSSQAQDENLASKMQKGQRQQAIFAQQHTQRPDRNLVPPSEDLADEVSDVLASNGNNFEQESEREFNDLDDSDRDEDLICYRYIVKAHYIGVPDFEAESEYYQKFLHLEKAAGELANWIQVLKNWYQQSVGTKRNSVITETITENAGLIEHTIGLGRDGQMSCRAWIEKEEYCPSRKAYKNAKVRRACNAKSVYTVRWEKTTTPALLGRDAAEGSNAEQPINQVNSAVTKQSLPQTGLNGNSEEADDGMTDLFDPTPPPPENTHPLTSAIESGKFTTSVAVTTEIDYKAQRYFTNIALANRHAKDVFMRWYIDHMRGQEYFETIRLEDEMIENQIESYGDTLAWEREDDFDYYDPDNAAGGGTAASTGNETGLPAATKGSMTVLNEKFRIWVEAVSVTGPAN